MGPLPIKPALAGTVSTAAAGPERPFADVAKACHADAVADSPWAAVAAGPATMAAAMCSR